MLIVWPRNNILLGNLWVRHLCGCHLTQAMRSKHSGRPSTSPVALPQSHDYRWVQFLLSAISLLLTWNGSCSAFHSCTLFRSSFRIQERSLCGYLSTDWNILILDYRYWSDASADRNFPVHHNTDVFKPVKRIKQLTACVSARFSIFFHSFIF